MIRIAIPQTQRAVRDHMEKSGWKVKFDRGIPRDNYPEGQELNIGKIEGREDQVVQLRTMDALWAVSEGYCDVGIIGSDAVQEKEGIYNVEFLDEYHYGRLLGDLPPRLEVVVHPDSKVRSIEDFIGAIFLTERPNLTRTWLESFKLNVILEENQSPTEFRRIVKETGSVGIHVILGSSPAQLRPEGVFGVMVNESGETVNDYNLRVIAEITPIHTWLVANPDSLRNESIKEIITQFQRDLTEATLGKEFVNRNPSAGPERDI